MENKLLNVIKNNHITFITGPARTGKSWLLNKYENLAHVINKKDKAMNGDSCRLTTEDMRDLSLTEHDVITVDEAQLLDDEQILDIATFALMANKKLILACQSKENIPHFKLFKLCSEQDKSCVHIELTN